MIIIRLLGGLGNQLFQYSFGRRIAFEANQDLVVDTRLLCDSARGRHSVNRNYGLDIFNAEINHARLLDVIPYSADGLPRPVRGFLRATGICRPSRQAVEQRFGFDQQMVKVGAGYYSGLWQSGRYFETVEFTIRSDLKFRYKLPDESADLAARISNQESVCLHVRRTDYVTHASSSSPLGFVGLEYYRNALRRLMELTHSPSFFVFSDDIEWCRRELSFLPNATFVGNEHAGYKDGGHLQLMTMCKHFIIPNSTFSWWAAWLCDHGNKIVCLPDLWFRDPSFDASGLYPSAWLSVPTSATSTAP